MLNHSNIVLAETGLLEDASALCPIDASNETIFPRIAGNPKTSIIDDSMLVIDDIELITKHNTRLNMANCQSTSLSVRDLVSINNRWNSSMSADSEEESGVICNLKSKAKRSISFDEVVLCHEIPRLDDLILEYDRSIELGKGSSTAIREIPNAGLASPDQDVLNGALHVQIEGNTFVDAQSFGRKACDGVGQEDQAMISSHYEGNPNSISVKSLSVQTISADNSEETTKTQCPRLCYYSGQYLELHEEQQLAEQRDSNNSIWTSFKRRLVGFGRKRKLAFRS